MPISGRFSDSPADELLGTDSKYLPSSLADLVAWQLWRKDSGPLPILGGKATATELTINPSQASIVAFGPGGQLAAYVSPFGQTIRCESGYFVFERQLYGSTEGTASTSNWTLYIAVTASGELIAKEMRSERQRSMLVINTYSSRDRWYRFVSAK